MQPGRDTAALTIGRLAQLAAVNVETIRYYQRIGLIEQPRRPGQGFRHYPPGTVRRVRFIRRAQQLGFSLQEIAELLSLDKGDCEAVRQRAEQKREQILAQIRDLTTLQHTLEELITTCQHGNDTQHCPLIENLIADS